MKRKKYRLRVLLTTDFVQFLLVFPLIFFLFWYPNVGFPITFSTVFNFE